MTVKDRLETLRKMFAEDEMNQHVTRIQQAWEQQDSQIGLATMCIGLGQGISTIIERV